MGGGGELMHFWQFIVYYSSEVVEGQGDFQRDSNVTLNGLLSFPLASALEIRSLCHLFLQHCT